MVFCLTSHGWVQPRDELMYPLTRAVCTTVTGATGRLLEHDPFNVDIRDRRAASIPTARSTDRADRPWCGRDGAARAREANPSCVGHRAPTCQPNRTSRSGNPIVRQSSAGITAATQSPSISSRCRACHRHRATSRSRATCCREPSGETPGARPQVTVPGAIAVGDVNLPHRTQRKQLGGDPDSVRHQALAVAMEGPGMRLESSVSYQRSCPSPHWGSFGTAWQQKLSAGRSCLPWPHTIKGCLDPTWRKIERAHDQASRLRDVHLQMAEALFSDE